MLTIKHILWGIACGLWDSIRGMSLLVHIDNEIQRINYEKSLEKQQRQRARNQQRRSPSPAPSSASAMERDTIEAKYKANSARDQDNVDERHIDTVFKNFTPKLQNTQEPKGERKIAKQVLKCCLLNGGFTWASILIFEQIILPTIRLVLTLMYGENSSELHVLWGWLHSILSIIFGMMWVLPIFILSKVVSSLWFADIANAAYRVRKGRPQMITSISKLIADFLFSLLVQFLFLIQSMLLNFLPLRYVGQSLCFIHLCLLYSLYSFEYKWVNMGWELHRRLSYIENNWPYFIGFGMPLTLLTNMTDSIIVSSCIFSIFFPLFILSGNEAKPIVGTTDLSLRLFSPVVFFANLFFSRPNKSGEVGETGSSYEAKQRLKETQRMLQQQQIEHEYRQLHLQRELENKQKQKQKTEYRYQQPPPLRVPSSVSASSDSSNSMRRHLTPERSGSRSRRYGGMRPLIPTPVPGAPTGLLSTTSSHSYH